MIFYGGLFISFLIGYFLATFVIARDSSLVKLKQDQVIVQKPGEGLVLVAVTPDVMRRLIMEPVESTGNEARTLYPRKKSKT